MKRKENLDGFFAFRCDKKKLSQIKKLAKKQNIDLPNAFRSSLYDLHDKMIKQNEKGV